MVELDTEALREFALNFPETFFKAPSGPLPDNTHLVFSLKEAVDIWEPEGHSVIIEDPDALDFNKSGRIVCGPHASDNGSLYHGIDLLEVLYGPRNHIYSKYELRSSVLRKALRENLTFCNDIFSGNFHPLSEASSIFSTVGTFLLSPDKNQFPYFNVIIDILMSGGLPIGWKGQMVGPIPDLEYNKTYALKSGAFIVFWPYNEAPEFV